MVLQWKTSSYSTDWNQALCVEVAAAGEMWHVRDSKNPDGPALEVPAAGWAQFTDWLKTQT